MKLWIDDLRDRPDTSWTLARTITEAIRLIATFEWDEVSLDCDCGTPNESFMAVAYYICARYRKHDNCECDDDPIMPKISIHSANPACAEDMRKLFEEHGIVAIINPAIKQ